MLTGCVDGGRSAVVDGVSRIPAGPPHCDSLDIVWLSSSVPATVVGECFILSGRAARDTNFRSSAEGTGSPVGTESFWLEALF